MPSYYSLLMAILAAVESDDDNLRFWCQQCHFRHDTKQPAASARITRKRKAPQVDIEDIGWCLKQKLDRSRGNFSSAAIAAFPEIKP